MKAWALWHRLRTGPSVCADLAKPTPQSSWVCSGLERAMGEDSANVMACHGSQLDSLGPDQQAKECDSLRALFGELQALSV